MGKEAQAGYRAAGSLVPDAVKAPIASGAQVAADALDKTSLGQTIGDTLMKGENAYSGWAKNNPRASADVEAVANLLPFESAARGAKEIATGIGNAADASLESRWPKSPEGAQSPAVQAYQATKGRNTAYVEGMNANAENMKQSYGKIYDNAGQISQDATISAPKMKSNVDAMVDNLDNDLAHKTEQGSSQAYRDMKAVQDSFDENGVIPLDKVTLLKRRLNDLYSPDMGDTRGKIYSQLNNQLNDLIKRAKVENPEWGSMMDSGNQLFNNYKSTFDVDDMSNQKWSLADKKDYEDAKAARINDPYSAPPTTATREKIANITDIKSLPQYESMLRKLPPEMHDQFTQDVIAANAETNPKVANALRALYKGFLGNKFGAANDFYRAITSKTQTAIDPSLAEDYPHVEDAISYHTGKADSAYNKYMNNLYSSQNPPTPLALPEPSTKLPAEQSGLYKALPAPNPKDYPMVNERNTSEFGKPTRGNMRYMTQEETENYIAQQQAKSPDVSTGERAAQQDRAATQAADKLKKAQEAYKNNQENSPTMGLPEYKRGGAVNKQPTEAQKAVGNYKKGHVKLHGLNITIENPKGSKRSGVSAGGAKWESTLAADYGYIRNTVGNDGDHIDCFLGPDEKSKRVYVIDQKNDDGKFDEHKCMLNFMDRDAAEKAYRNSFSDKKNRIMKVTRLTIPEFKAWLKQGNTKKPMRKAA